MLLSTLPEKLSLLESVGVGATVVVPFDKRSAGAVRVISSATTWSENCIWMRCWSAIITIWGHNKEGDYDSLSALSAECGFALERMPCQQVGE